MTTPDHGAYTVVRQQKTEEAPMSRSGDYQMVTQEVERLKDEGRKATISGLARRLGLSRNTVRKYLKEGFRPHASKGTKRGSLLDPYKEWLQEQLFIVGFISA